MTRSSQPSLLRHVDRRAARALVVIGDILMVNLAFVIAYWLRYTLEIGREVLEQNFVPLSAYFPIQIGFTLIMLVVYFFAGLYQDSRRSALDDAPTIVSATSIGIMLTLAVAFMYQGYAFSRLLFIYVWALVIVLLTIARIFRQVVLAYLRARGIGIRRVVVAGSGALGRMVMHVLATELEAGYQVVGFVDDNGTDRAGRFQSLGSTADVEQVVQEHDIDEVIIALPSHQHERVLSLVNACNQKQIEFRVVPDLFEFSLTRVDVDVLRGVPLIGVRAIHLSDFNLLLKRVVDLVGASLLIVVLFPVWLAIAILIKVESPGPVLFRQVRLGRNEKPFLAYKFRSMRQGAEQEQKALERLNEADGPIFKIKHDPRVTRVGRWLRRTSLDELPQLLNVICGEMSLVGPRPPIPSEVEQYEDWQRQRLNVAPGMTGLWQVSGRSELPFDEMVMLDLYYIENWSLSLDMKIILRTIPAVLSGQGAY